MPASVRGSEIKACKRSAEGAIEGFGFFPSARKSASLDRTYSQEIPREASDRITRRFRRSQLCLSATPPMPRRPRLASDAFSQGCPGAWSFRGRESGRALGCRRPSLTFKMNSVRGQASCRSRTAACAWGSSEGELRMGSRFTSSL